MKTNKKSHFNFKLYVRTQQGQEFLIRSIGIDADNYHEADKIYRKLDLPFHHFATVKKIS